MWIKHFIKEVIGVEMKNFVIFGDSSGGNFAMGVSYWLLESNLCLPSLISLSYPCMRMRFREYSPSMLLCLEDLILNYGGIGMVRTMYLDDASLIDLDPYLTPILMNDEILL
jgi:hormone-sensitive lipase